ncbi:MAG: MATE family efflux transporter [Clostridia bacterium]
MLITKDKSFYKNLVALAVPISLQNMVTFSVGFADNLMIGSLGDTAISGVYMGNQLQTVFQMFIMGIEGALLILAAQYWGKRDTNSIKKILAIAIKLALAFGIVFTTLALLFPSQIINLFTNDTAVIQSGTVYLSTVAFSYIFFAISQIFIGSMRSVETAKIGLYISFMTLAVDVGLNYLLIFGVDGLIPALGIQGAAIATLIARICEAVAIVYYVKFKDKKLKIKFKELVPTDTLMIKDFVKYGLPVLGGQIVWGCNTIANSMILGRFNAEVIAATSMTGMLHSLVYVWMTGLSSAVGIITGKTVGAGKIDKIKEYSKTVQIMFVCVGILSGLLVWSLHIPFIGLYDVSDEAAAYALQFMAIISITIVGTCYQAPCLAGLVKAGGDISFVFKNDSIFVFLVVIPSALVACYLSAPVWVVFACLKCDQILKCFVAVVKINKYNWIKNLTRENNT